MILDILTSRRDAVIGRILAIEVALADIKASWVINGTETKFADRVVLESEKAHLNAERHSLRLQIEPLALEIEGKKSMDRRRTALMKGILCRLLTERGMQSLVDEAARLTEDELFPEPQA